MPSQPTFVPSLKRLLPMFAIAILLLGAAFALAACGDDEKRATETTAATESSGATQTTGAAESTTFTLDELVRFDGKNGAAAYVAVDGVVYDVSESQTWQDGTHRGCGLGAMAGKDLSEVITQAPANMRALLESMPVVGTLAP